MYSLGLTDISLFINSIGDKESRPKYVEELKSYYAQRNDKLCNECQNRLERNPLRLLDCKVESCRAIGEDAPRSVDHLDPDSQDHWDRLQDYLAAMEIPYEVDHRLVRGLDYYSRTVFEIQPAEAGAQSTICGGGRYDGLMEQLGGRPTPGIGFGSGLERLTLNLKRSGVEVPDEPAPAYLVANVGDAARLPALELASQIRRAGAGAILSSGARALRGQMRQANSLGISYAIILGDDEIARGEVVVRDMQTSTQETRPLSEFLQSLASS
jgi:histidyl-tRNA synthetase